jgi:copper chaperone CopZ
MRVELSIESMHCEHCASNIERYLKDQPDVRAAEVDYEANTGWIKINDDVDVGTLVETIDAMGYDASVTSGV